MIAGDELVTVNVKLPAGLLDRIDREAERRVVGRQLLIRAAIAFGLDALPEVPGK